MFNDDWNKDFDKRFDKQFDKAQKFAKVWFAFVALLALALLSGVVFVIYRLMLHLGIM